MALTAAQLKRGWRLFVRHLSGGSTVRWTRPELLAAATAANAWADANAAGYVAALQADAPDFAGRSTADEKLLLLLAVLAARLDVDP